MVIGENDFLGYFLRVLSPCMLKCKKIDFIFKQSTWSQLSTECISDSLNHEIGPETTADKWLKPNILLISGLD